MNELHGIELVAQALKLEAFPCDKQALYYSVGDIEIEDSIGQHVAVRDVLEQVVEAKFMTARDALHAICRAADKRRKSVA